MLKKVSYILFTLIIHALTADAQHTVMFKVIDADTKAALPGVNVSIIGSNLGTATDRDGSAAVRNVNPGTHQFLVSMIGYERTTLTLRVPEETAEVIEVELEHHHEDLEEVTVYAARGSRLIDRVPTRAEVIAGEELQEKANMNSSNISMILRETPGVQVQMTDPSTANMSFRIQGLNGRYTQLLQDGLPIYGGISSSLSIVQIPPLNLKQVEIIKGSSSTLYGGGAIAGLVNLVTKTPDDEGTTVMLNAMSTVGADLNAFSAGHFGRVGYTAYMSGVNQRAYDVNNDGFAEVPKTNRIHLEPTLWIPVGSSAMLRTGIGYTRDQREGGFQNRDGFPEIISINYYTSKIETDRFKALADLELDASSRGKIQFRNALSLTQSKSNDNLKHLLTSDQTQYFSEASSSFGNDRSDFTIGLSFLYNDTESTYKNVRIIQGADTKTVGAFAQHTLTPADPITIEAGLRAETVSGNKTIILPRINVLSRWGPSLTSRVGFGTGYKHIHGMFSEVNDYIQQSNHMDSYRLTLSDPNAIERSIGFTADIDYRTLLNGDVGLSVNQLFFYTRINDPFQLRRLGIRYGSFAGENDIMDLEPFSALEIGNRNGNTTTAGLETNLKWTYNRLKWYQFYTFTDVREDFGTFSEDAILTPKHRFGSVIMLEEHDSYRIGFETYINGRQKLSNGDTTDPYVIMGFMAEKTWERISLFINFENFTDTRIDDKYSLWGGSLSHPTLNTDLYAPIDGVVINGGVKIRF